jgi:hypothetical protein
MSCYCSFFFLANSLCASVLVMSIWSLVFLYDGMPVWGLFLRLLLTIKLRLTLLVFVWGSCFYLGDWRVSSFDEIDFMSSFQPPNDNSPSRLICASKYSCSIPSLYLILSSVFIMPSEHKALTDTESCKTKTGDLALLFGVLLLFNYSNFCFAGSVSVKALCSEGMMNTDERMR